MEYNSNWSRWVKSSCARHFKDCNSNYFVEGFERDTNGLPEWVEFRIDGPYLKESTRGQWKLNIEINILISVTGGQDSYRIERIEGDVTKHFLDCLEIYKLGQDEADDGSLLGCFKLVQQGRDKIIVTNFGKLKPDVNLYQKSIEGHYQMFLG